MGIKTITLHIAVDNDITEQDVGQLLRDALGEFVAKRTPTEEYVDKRYHLCSSSLRSSKLQEVFNRVMFAEMLIKATISVEQSGCASCGQTVGCNLACDECMQTRYERAMTMNIEDLDAFTIAYIEAALWAGTDERDIDGNDGEPLDTNYSIDDLAAETLKKVAADCKRFQQENARDLASMPSYMQWSSDEMSGHDFLLSRNGHGVGFQDRGYGDLGDRLQDAARAYGEVWFYVGDDNLIYC